MSTVKYAMLSLQPLAIRKIAHDGILLNGLRYQHSELARHIDAEAKIYSSATPELIIVFVDELYVCNASVQNSFTLPSDQVGREVMVINGEYAGASGVIMQVNCAAPRVIYHVRLYGGDELHSYCGEEFVFGEDRMLDIF